MARATFLCAATICAQAAFDCSFNSSIPRQHIAYHMDHEPKMDGKLDDPAWQEVGFTEDFVDIATNITPQFRTRAKIRWTDSFLYIGAAVDDPAVWANITHTCREGARLRYWVCDYGLYLGSSPAFLWQIA